QMARHWTFGQKVGASFALLVALAIVMGLVAFLALRTVVSSKDRVIDIDAQLLIGAQHLHALRESKGSSAREFLLTRDEQALGTMQQARADVVMVLAQLKRNVSDEDGQRLVEAIIEAETANQRAIDDVVALRRTNVSLDEVVRAFENRIDPTRDRLDAAIRTFVSREEQRLQGAKQASTETASLATMVVAVLVAIVLLCAIATGVVLTKTLGRQIGPAVSQVQSWSAVLQAAAHQ